MTPEKEMWEENFQKLRFTIIASLIYQECLKKTTNLGLYEPELASKKTVELTRILMLEIEKFFDEMPW